MALFNSGFPASYQPMGYNPYQAYQQPTQMSPANDMIPTIHAEIKQVDSVAAIDNIPMAGGATQMFMTKDDKTIVIRSMFVNGQHSDEIYDKRPPAPPAPKLDPSEYVRRDEVEMLIAAALTAQKKEAAE